MLVMLFTVSALYHMIGLYCSMTRVGHSGMTADEVTENIEAAVKTAVDKIRMVSFGQLNWTNFPKITYELTSAKSLKSLFFGTFSMSWLLSCVAAPVGISAFPYNFNF